MFPKVDGPPKMDLAGMTISDLGGGDDDEECGGGTFIPPNIELDPEAAALGAGCPTPPNMEDVGGLNCVGLPNVEPPNSDAPGDPGGAANGDENGDGFVLDGGARLKDPNDGGGTGSENDGAGGSWGGAAKDTGDAFVVELPPACGSVFDAPKSIKLTKPGGLTTLLCTWARLSKPQSNLGFNDALGEVDGSGGALLGSGEAAGE